MPSLSKSITTTNKYRDRLSRRWISIARRYRQLRLKLTPPVLAESRTLTATYRCRIRWRRNMKLTAKLEVQRCRSSARALGFSNQQGPHWPLLKINLLPKSFMRAAQSGPQRTSPQKSGAAWPPIESLASKEVLVPL